MCKIYDPAKNRPNFIPKSRNGWIPLYPVWKDKIPNRPVNSWWFLYECEHCGVEGIFATASSPNKCKCQHQRTVPYSGPAVGICDNCGSKYPTTKEKLNNSSRHYCSEKCKKEYQKKLKPSKEWQRMGCRPRNRNLKAIRPWAKFDGIRASACDNVIGG